MVENGGICALVDHCRCLSLVKYLNEDLFSDVKSGVGRKEKCLWERKITFPFREKERKEKSKIFQFEKKERKEKSNFSKREKWER